MLFRASLFIFWAVITAAGSPYSSLKFFGDSLTDTGNVLKATSTLRRYTLGLVPKHPVAPYAAGRFTNGKVWAEHVAERLGHPGDAAYGGMSMGVFGQIGGPGNNFAIGGARTDDGGALGFLDFAIPTGISSQVDFYLSRSGGVADPDALYFLLGSGNDLRDAARISDPVERRIAAERAGANLAFSVRDLYMAGARKFVLINSPDIGMLPETIGDGLTVAGTEVATHFNTWFGLYGDYLRYEVPEFSLEYFDLFGLHRELIAQYGAGAIRTCKDEPAACDQSLFFDSVHPTAWVHEVFAQRLADQILGSGSRQSNLLSSADEIQTPEPATALLTLSAIAAFAVARRKVTINACTRKSALKRQFRS